MFERSSVALALATGSAVISILAITSSRRCQLRYLKKQSNKRPIYSAAVIDGDIAYVSGQVGQVNGVVVPGGVSAETHQALTNLEEVLKRGGSSLAKVVKTTCYLADMDTYAEFNEAYLKFFSDPAILPARVCIAVRALPIGANVEIDCIARVE